MARLPRLVLAGHAHCIVQRAHSGQPIFSDQVDRAAYLDALRQAAATEHVQVHAWALLASEALLLATPSEAPALGRMVQALGRRYERLQPPPPAPRTIWDGRFRCAVIEPGALRLAALRWVDGQSLEPHITTAAQRLGAARDTWLMDPPEVWLLGNTPFEREAAYGALLAEGLPVAVADLLRSAALGGWAVGSAAFVPLEQTVARQHGPGSVSPARWCRQPVPISLLAWQRRSKLLYMSPFIQDGRLKFLLTLTQFIPLVPYAALR